MRTMRDSDIRVLAMEAVWNRMLCGLGTQQCTNSLNHGALQSGYATMRNAQCNNSEDNLF